MSGIERDLGRTRDGGSCSRCDSDYTGSPYSRDRGRRVIAEIEPGVVEPVNVCSECFEDMGGDR
jgi:hypothetical protein